jgi:DNA mismatch repair ATPase MutS
MCRPIVLQTKDNQQPFINIHDGKHPCMLQKATDTFIPNDIILADKVNFTKKKFYYLIKIFF